MLGHSCSDPSGRFSLSLLPLCLCFTLPLDHARSGQSRQSLFLWESWVWKQGVVSPRGAGQHLLTLRKICFSAESKHSSNSACQYLHTPHSACLCLHRPSQVGKSCRDFSTSIPGLCLPSLPSQQRTPGGGRRRGGGQGVTGKSEGYNIPGAVGQRQSLWLIPEGRPWGWAGWHSPGIPWEQPCMAGAGAWAGDTAVPPVWGQPGHPGELQSVHGCRGVRGG